MQKESEFMLDSFATLVGNISGLMYGSVLIILLVGCGLYFTIRTKGVQLRMLGESIRVITEKKTDDNAVSSFQALMVSTASRVGTGNIVGVANAIAIGGYGSVFWMWLIALVGGASAFIESTLAQVYKKRDDDGGSYGGPAYYIEAALHSRALGVVFAVALIACYAVGFNMLCSYNLITSFSGYSFYGDPETSIVPLIGGALIALLVAFCILGGGQRVVKVASFLVPFMGVIYIAMALLVCVLNLTNIPAVLAAIFKEAFTFEAAAGGIIGETMMQGIKRGLYSNEAGVGSAPNAAAAADVSHPVKQGLVQMLSVFIDTLLICTATSMMCLAGGLTPSPDLKGAPFVQEALSMNFGSFGYYFITFALFLFAFTTLIGNLFYCEGAVNYIAGHTVEKKTMNIFRIIACIIVFIGAQLSFGLVWDLADVIMGIMVFINLPVCLVLCKTAIACLDDYIAQRKEGKEPVFKAKNIGLEAELDYWQ